MKSNSLLPLRPLCDPPAHCCRRVHCASCPLGQWPGRPCSTRVMSCHAPSLHLARPMRPQRVRHVEEQAPATAPTSRRAGACRPAPMAECRCGRCSSRRAAARKHRAQVTPGGPKRLKERGRASQGRPEAQQLASPSGLGRTMNAPMATCRCASALHVLACPLEEQPLATKSTAHPMHACRPAPTAARLKRPLLLTSCRRA